MQQTEYLELLRLALKAEKAYYDDDNPIMEDGTYDAIIKNLKEFEQDNPTLKMPNSPTDRVGGHASNSFEKVTFPVRMLSLKNAFTDEELENFMGATKENNLGYIVQPKLDGLTLVLWYADGFLIKAATRGNGSVGEDVTLSAARVAGIPLEIPCTDAFLVRGEVVMHKDAFNELNKLRESQGKPLYANARNVAAGSVRQKDPAGMNDRHLNFYAYDVPSGLQFITEVEMLGFLVEQGFTTPRTYSINDQEYMVSQLIDRVHTIKRQEDQLPYAIDGAVVKTLSRGSCRVQLGEGTHDPNWAVAFKFTPVSAITKLLSVIWQTGRTGRMTPVAVLDPVELCGSVVERASLHNMEYIQELNLHIGDMVSVYKAAEIIPQIDCVVESMNGDNIIVPSLCPDCGAELTIDGPTLICTNEECVAKLKAELRYFVSRQNMDIQGIGPAVIDELVASGRIHSPADLYKMEPKDFLTPGLIAEAKANSIAGEIWKSKQLPFHRVLSAIGIAGVSTTTATQLADAFGSMRALLKASIPELMEVEGIAETSAREIFNSLHNPRKAELINALALQGLRMEQVCRNLESHALEDKLFCITGTLSQPREEIKQLIEAHGGRVMGSISSNVDYLVAGSGGGSKRAKAQKFGVEIINENQLKEMIQ